MVVKGEIPTVHMDPLFVPFPPLASLEGGEKQVAGAAFP